MQNSVAELTRILQNVDCGDSSSTEELLLLVYDELRRIAQKMMNDERPEHTLQATALVHETYLRLMGADNSFSWQSRGHFFAAAAEAMRRLLVDHARRRLTEKRGGKISRSPITPILLANEIPPDKLLHFNDVLERFADEDPVKAELVKLRCFAGLDREELSNVLDISLASVDRYWKYAKVRLYCELVSDDKHCDAGKPLAESRDLID